MSLHIRGLEDLKSPTPTGTQIKLPDFAPSEISQSATIIISYPDGTTETATAGDDGTVTPAYVTIKNGYNHFHYSHTMGFGGHSSTSTGEFDIYGQPNYYPLKPWTYKEVIERALELCEPRIWNKRAGDYIVPPRFNFRYNDPNDAHEIDVFDNLAPEFTFTRCTLRELLQEIGGALNKEPRLDENDNVYFVDFGGKELATFLSAKTNTVKPFLKINRYPRR